MFRRYLNLVLFVLPALIWFITGFFISVNAAGTPPPANNYAPNLWFSSGEKYFPANPLDFYYENGQEIWHQNGLGSVDNFVAHINCHGTIRARH